MITRMLNESFEPLMRLQGQMGQLLESFFEDMPAIRPYGAAYPGINLWEDGENGYLEAELPGLTLENIEVYVKGSEVTISGQRSFPTQEGVNWYRHERAQGNFSRTITVPWEIDPDKVQAKLQDGVLTVTLPKTESHKPRKVTVLSS